MDLEEKLSSKPGFSELRSSLEEIKKFSDDF